VEARVSITTKCNARCKTCPVWSIPGSTMLLDDFKTVWRKLSESPTITGISLNNTGDIYCVPDHAKYLDLIHRVDGKWIAMTTNGIAFDMIPDVDLFIISFNGGTKGTYEYTVGADFDKVAANIRSHYSELAKLRYCQLHCLMWEGNKGIEYELTKLWADFPGSVRISYKYDNQGGVDYTIAQFKKESRIVCDYLGKLCIMPNGQVIPCAHDFHAEVNMGNILTDSVEFLIKNEERRRMLIEQANDKFEGICERCNYNTPADGRVIYVKG
jgi:radical SAM protein with 4Fe4S-binding SPASM domain